MEALPTVITKVSIARATTRKKAWNIFLLLIDFLAKKLFFGLSSWLEPY
jgi:hypothetical protein